MTIVKTFIEALGIVNSRPERLKIYLRDKRLSRVEKTILQCWLDLRDNKVDAVIEALQDLDILDNVIIQSQRDFLLGTTFINRGESHRAIGYLKNAVHLLNDFPLPHHRIPPQTL